MIEICSLDFLKKEKFETDILTVDGRVLFSAQDKVTPELILRLYFKKIYIKEPIVESKPSVEKIEDDKIVEQLESMTPDIFVEPEPEPVFIDEENDYLVEKLEFDEDEANRISEYSKLMGQSLKFSEKSLKELEQAAYYHNIGRTRFTKGDLKDKDFQKKQALAGYEIILHEKKLGEKIAETAKLCTSSYDSDSFKLDEEIPYYQIVQIASFYDKLMNKNHTNDEALNIMLQLGGNKFNIFVVHKFIKIMRNQNG